MGIKLIAIAAAASLAATPCAAAAFDSSAMTGARQMGAGAGLYLTLPFGGARSGKPQAGLRMQMMHDYRSAAAPHAPVVRADTFDLRLIGDEKPTLYVANRAVTGKHARRSNLAGGSDLLTIAIIAAAAVGGYVFVDKVLNDGDDNCTGIPICE